MSEPLLPCPFCGGEAVNDNGLIHCGNTDHCEPPFTIGEWNRRAPPADLLRELREASAPIVDESNITGAAEYVVISLTPREWRAIRDTLARADVQLEGREPQIVRPKIICLCGSTRFTSEMLIFQWELTKQGNIVLSWCALPDSYFEGRDKTHVGDQEGVKEIVDEVHKRKIDLADEVMVLNIGGYVGESTRSEINYALAHGKPVYYLEPDPEPPKGDGR